MQIIVLIFNTPSIICWNQKVIVTTSWRLIRNYRTGAMLLQQIMQALSISSGIYKFIVSEGKAEGGEM